MRSSSMRIDIDDPRLPARFWDKVSPEPNTGCWLWTGGVATATGYGRFWWHGDTRLSHRVAYEVLVGPIPVGLQMDHVRARGCASRSCCNPAHLEPVTVAENIRRGDTGVAWAARQRARGGCSKGHLYTEENTLIRRRGRTVARVCRECQRIWNRAYELRRSLPATQKQ